MATDTGRDIRLDIVDGHASTAEAIGKLLEAVKGVRVGEIVTSLPFRPSNSSRACDAGSWNYRARALFLASSSGGSGIYTRVVITDPQMSEFCSEVV